MSKKKSKKKQPKYLVWSARKIIIEPFPKSPFDFDKVCKCLDGYADSIGSSSGFIDVMTMETPGEIAKLLAKKGIEASDVYERTTYTVMKNWRK